LYITFSYSLSSSVVSLLLASSFAAYNNK
jgi:hypothetical protein